MLRTHASAFHPRPDPGAHALHAGHGEGGVAHRRPVADQTKRDIDHYNFPLFCVGETGFMRGRKWRASVTARSPSGRASRSSRARSTSLHAVRRLEVLESNAPVDGVGMRLDALADGRRVRSSRRGRDRDGADQGGRRLRHPDRHRGSGGRLATWTSRSRTTRRDRAGEDIKITGVTTRSCSALSQRDAGSTSGQDREAIAEPGSSSRPTRRGSSARDRSDFIGMVIGKGGETIGAQADYEVQIDIEEDGTHRIYGTNGERPSRAGSPSRR